MPLLPPPLPRTAVPSKPKEAEPVSTSTPDWIEGTDVGRMADANPPAPEQLIRAGKACRTDALGDGMSGQVLRLMLAVARVNGNMAGAAFASAAPAAVAAASNMAAVYCGMSRLRLGLSMLAMAAMLSRSSCVMCCPSIVCN